MTTEVGKKNNREYEYDVMRVVAALAVVIIHVCAPQWKSLNVYSTDWTIMTVCAGSAYALQERLLFAGGYLQI